MTQKLEDSTWDSLRAISTGVESVYAFRILRAGEPLWISWWDYFSKPYPGDSVIFILSGISTNRIAVTNFIPIDTVGGNARFRVDTLPVISNQARIILRHNPILIEEMQGTGLKEMQNALKIQALRLFQSKPDPFNSTTTIRFLLPQPEHVILKVFDVLGREVTTLVDGKLNPGEHSVVFSAVRMPSGIYFYRLSTGNRNETKKMVLLR